MWCCLEDQPGQEITQHHIHRAGSSRVWSKVLPCSCSYWIFGAFLQQEEFHGGSEGEQAALHLHEGTTKARQSSLLSWKKAQAVPVCVLGHSLDVDLMGMAQSPWSQSWLAPQVGFHGHPCTTEPGASEGAGLQGTSGSPADLVAAFV